MVCYCDDRKCWKSPLESTDFGTSVWRRGYYPHSGLVRILSYFRDTILVVELRTTVRLRRLLFDLFTASLRLYGSGRAIGRVCVWTITLK